jgi:F-type H+-transporting ATPase subunit b
MIWTIVTFLVVMLILRATAWKPIMSALAEREKKIEGAIADASRIKNEAEQLHAKYLTLLDRAKDDARSILDEARKDGIALQEEIRNRAKQEAEEFKTRAHREIELQKDSAIKEIWEQTAGLATTLAGRVLGRSLQSADQERLVRELLAGMQEETSATAGSGRAPERRA